MDDILQKIRRELLENAEEATRLSGQRFFKEAVRFHGVKSAVVDRISKASFKELKGLDKAEVFRLCEELWRSGYMEEGFIACNWSYFLRKSYEPEDFPVFARWVSDYVGNWAACDTLCNHTVGTFIEMYPEFLADLKVWARSENRWMRRAAAVSLIIPARKGRFLADILAIADILLLDGDDLVQKGYGWMLKAASQSHQQEIFDYVVSKKAVMPRTALRYAIEKMPKDLKAEAMKKG
ncbi:MAG: DNA alkylation repair protein [Desulforhopalus sp.]|nr:DNA alkylation repair protein [Desulforhopalus sp.]